MADSDAQLKIGADTSLFDDTIKKTESKLAASFASMGRSASQLQSTLSPLNATAGNLQANFGHATSAVENLGGSFKMLTGTLGKVMGLLAGGALFGEAVSRTLEWGSSVGQLSKQLGISAEQAAALSLHAKETGVDTAVLGDLSDRASKQILKNGQAFEKLGINVRDTNGHYKTGGQLLPEIADKLRGIANPTERAMVAQSLLKAGYSETKDLLKSYSAGLAESAARVKEMGLAMDPDQVTAYKSMMAQNKTTINALFIAVGQQLLPVLTTLGSWFAEIGPTLVRGFSEVMKGLSFAVIGLGYAFQGAGILLGAFAAAAATAAAGNFSGAKQIIKDAIADVDALDAKMREKQKMLYEDPKNWKKSTVPDDQDATIPDLKKESKMPIFEAGLAKQKAAFEQMNGIVEYSKQQEMAYWEAVSKKGGLSREEQLNVDRKVAEARLAIFRQSRDHAIKMTEDEIVARQKAANDEIAAVKRANDFEVATGRVTMEQAVQQEIDLANKQNEVQRQSLLARLALLGLDPTKNAAAIAKLNGDLLDQERQHAGQVQAILLKSAEERLAIAKQMEQQGIDAREAAALAQIELDAEANRHAVAMGQMTQVTLLQQEAAFEQRRLDIQRAALKEKVALLAQDPTRNAAQIQALNLQIENLERQHNLKITKDTNKSAESAKQSWQQLTQSMSTSMLGTANSILRGQQTIAGAFKSLLGSMLDNLAQYYIEQELKQALTSTKVVTIKAGEADGVIGANAGEAASGAAAAVASIPIIGPVLASSAFASVLAVALGAKSLIPSARGGFDIPAGLNPLTQLHEKEMVLPAAQAEAVRRMAANGSTSNQGQQAAAPAGDVHHHNYSINVQTMDQRGVADWFRKNSAALAPGLRGVARNFTPVMG